MKTRLILSILAGLLPAMSTLHSADISTAAEAINSTGIELLQKTGDSGTNALLSPYSIQSALAMVFAGADGKTRDEMAKALHFPADVNAIENSFSGLRKALEKIQTAPSNAPGNAGPSITLSVANRLYGQEGYDFRKPFLDLLKSDFGAPFEAFDFKKEPEKARTSINTWVEDQTHQRISNLIPQGAIDPATRLVLVNAIYLKAPWAEPFMADTTQPQPFHTAKPETFNTPTMCKKMTIGYAALDGYSVITIFYSDSDLQFVILLPDKPDGLPALEKKLTPKMLADCANMEHTLALLYLPKFKLEPPAMELSSQLQALGMKSAFDIPRHSADFDGIAPRKPEDYLYLSQVFHKTFFSLDENGTEAAAATAAVMMVGSAYGGPPIKLTEVHVDHPFLFAIQHTRSGACLFLGRLNDPR